MPKCEDCRYWVRVQPVEDGQGSCHRFPPVDSKHFGSPDGARVFYREYKGIWHNTAPNDWCGEFKAKESESP